MHSCNNAHELMYRNTQLRTTISDANSKKAYQSLHKCESLVFAVWVSGVLWLAAIKETTSTYRSACVCVCVCERAKASQ